MATEKKRKKAAEGRDLPDPPRRNRTLPLRTKKNVIRNPNPNPYITGCHRCKITSTDLQTLDSRWRISLLCKKCHDLVQSAMVCSYCFVPFSADEDVFLNCLQCFRRIHYICIPHHRFYVLPSQIDPESFYCVDCCPVPKSPNLGLNPSYRVSPASPAPVSDSRWIMNGSKRILKSSARKLPKEDTRKEAEGSKSVKFGSVLELSYDFDHTKSRKHVEEQSLSDPMKFVTSTGEHNHSSNTSSLTEKVSQSSTRMKNMVSSIPSDSIESAEMWNWKKQGERRARGSIYPRKGFQARKHVEQSQTNL